MADFVQNIDQYAGKYTIDAETGELYFVNFSAFSSKDCSVSTFNDLTASA